MSTEQAVSSVLIIGECIGLRRIPDTPWFFGDCPFCSAKSSVVVDERFDYWACLSCGQIGTADRFARRLEQLRPSSPNIMLESVRNSFNQIARWTSDPRVRDEAISILKRLPR